MRAGTISVRPLTSRPDDEYILASLSADVAALEIVDVSGGEGMYNLVPAHVSLAESLPNSPGIEELGLTARAENALELLGIATVGDLRRADLSALWEVQHGPAAYAEPVQVLNFSRSPFE